MRFRALVTVLAALPGATVAAQAPPAAVPAAAPEPVVVVARARGRALALERLLPVLLDRFAQAPDGRATLRHLVKTNLIEHLGREAGIVVGRDEVKTRWDELDRRSRAAGEKDGLRGWLRDKGVPLETFLDGVRLSIVQERLTRAALDMRADAPVSGAQQEVWVEQEVTRRGLETLPRPWKDGVVARCGPVTVREHEFAEMLRTRLPVADVREAAWHLLLLDGIEARLPDLSELARSSSIARELERREQQARSRPGFEEVPYEDILAAEGLTPASLAREPSVAIAALSRLWVDRRWDEAGLKRVYEDERAAFDGKHGRAVRTRAIFLNAGKFVNDLVPRTFEQALDELEKLAARIGTVADFEALARRYTEDAGTRESGGVIGWVARGDERLPAELRAAAFDALPTSGELPSGGKRVGPFRMQSGCALVWIDGVREGPGWEGGMREHVHAELRRRFLEEVLPATEVVMVPIE